MNECIERLTRERNWRVLALDRSVPHDVEALEDSAFVLTIAWPPAGA